MSEHTTAVIGAGVIGLAFELTHPGAILPGVAVITKNFLN